MSTDYVGVGLRVLGRFPETLEEVIVQMSWNRSGVETDIALEEGGGQGWLSSEDGDDDGGGGETHCRVVE